LIRFVSERFVVLSLIFLTSVSIHNGP